MSGAGTHTDVVVVGAGIVGLACAAELARAGSRVVSIERHGDIARETTSRNSEVVHAGVYYPPGSSKAELCRSGRDALYARCASHGVPARRLGKLIVATESGEVGALERIHAQAAANDVALEWLDPAQVARLEPDVSAVAALLSPETGIVDATKYARSFQAEAEAHGAEFAFATEVVALEAGSAGFTVLARVAGAGGRDANAAQPLQRITCRSVVNAAGLAADRVAELAGIDVDDAGYRQHPCKGDYFALAAGAPISLSHLVYPVPGEAGLGIHATVDLGGRIRLGPDAEYVAAPRYDVDPRKADAFTAAAARYLPALEARWLSPDYAGVRAKRAAAGQGFADFVVEEESARGLPGLVSCIGIESPGLTAASAIGARVRRLLQGVIR
jgi:L-2-hydroxyglutarate oxidase LhgO